MHGKTHSLYLDGPCVGVFFRSFSLTHTHTQSLSLSLSHTHSHIHISISLCPCLLRAAFTCAHCGLTDASMTDGTGGCGLRASVHTMQELNMTGNALKGSRPLLSFDATFDSSPHWLLVKEMLTQVRPATPLTLTRRECVLVFVVYVCVCVCVCVCV
jgi:hypothetical protein